MKQKMFTVYSKDEDDAERAFLLEGAMNFLWESRPELREWAAKMIKDKMLDIIVYGITTDDTL